MTEIRYFLMLYVRSVRLIWRQITIFQKGSYKDAVHHTLLELLQDQGADIGKDEQFKLH